MAKKEDIYVSFRSDYYRAGKKDLLSCQVSLLRVLKRLQNIKKLRDRKAKLKIMLKNKLESVSGAAEKIEDQIPSSKIPKSLQNKTEKKEVVVKTSKNVSGKKDKLDLELQAIQDKLKELDV